MTTETRERAGRDRFATPRQARTAIENLSDTDHAKLMLIAKGFLRTRLQGNLVSPGDLLHDAILKTLEGQRHWNRQVTIVRHLDRVMESDSGHEAEKRRTHGQVPSEREAESVTYQPRPDHRLIVLDELEDALALFADDQRALGLLKLKAQGYSPSEIQRELGMEERQYDTTTKRIRRRILGYLADRPK